MPAFYRIESRKTPRVGIHDGAWYAVIECDRRGEIALSLTAKPSEFTTDNFARIVATLVAKGYEVRLAQ